MNKTTTYSVQCKIQMEPVFTSLYITNIIFYDVNNCAVNLNIFNNSAIKYIENANRWFYVYVSMYIVYRYTCNINKHI